VRVFVEVGDWEHEASAGLSSIGGLDNLWVVVGLSLLAQSVLTDL
jgi:hypothetical protein